MLDLRARQPRRCLTSASDRRPCRRGGGSNGVGQALVLVMRRHWEAVDGEDVQLLQMLCIHRATRISYIWVRLPRCVGLAARFNTAHMMGLWGR